VHRGGEGAVRQLDDQRGPQLRDLLPGGVRVTIRVRGVGIPSRRSSSSRKTLLPQRMIDCESSTTGIPSASARSANWNAGSLTPVSARMNSASYSGSRQLVQADAPHVHVHPRRHPLQPVQRLRAGGGERIALVEEDGDRRPPLLARRRRCRAAPRAAGRRAPRGAAPGRRRPAAAAGRARPRSPSTRRPRAGSAGAARGRPPRGRPRAPVRGSADPRRSPGRPASRPPPPAGRHARPDARSPAHAPAGPRRRDRARRRRVCISRGSTVRTPASWSERKSAYGSASCSLVATAGMACCPRASARSET
jgi:hypothetical protein